MSEFVKIILGVVVWLLLNLVVAFILALIADNLEEQEWFIQMVISKIYCLYLASMEILSIILLMEWVNSVIREKK